MDSQRFSHRFLLLMVTSVFCVGFLAFSGCKPPPPAAKSKSIINKKTDEIGEFDPNANRKVSDGKMDENAALLGPAAAAKAYGPIVEKISKMNIDYMLRLFEAEHGRFPKNHEEFMTKVIKRNRVQLPVLPGGAEYQYDVDNHKLVVVEAIKEESK